MEDTERLHLADDNQDGNVALSESDVNIVT